VHGLHGRDIRLAELVGVLSLATDLGLNQPLEHVLRQCRIALRLAERLELADAEMEALYFTALLAYAGCHVDAHEQARWFGDDLVLKADARTFSGSDLGYLVTHLGAGRPPLERLRLGLVFLSGEGRRAADSMFENHWQATEGLAKALGFDEVVLGPLSETFERWDGKGLLGTRGEACPMAARLTILADVVEIYHRTAGVTAAVAAARQRSGRQFDPALVEFFAGCAAEVLDGPDTVSTWEEVMAAEPGKHRHLAAERLDEVLESVADFVDLKAPHTLGHSRRVAEVAGAAAEALSLPAEESLAVRRAGLVHDLGRLGVSNAIWDKPGPLTSTEWERVRLHPYLSERMLGFSPALEPLAALAGRHRERLDGTGYPRNLHGDALTPPARTLAAADVYCAVTEPRPHRRALPADEAAKLLRAEARACHLDGDAVDAVLSAVGHQPRRRHERPAGLTAREVEVLRLLARGQSTKEIADQLVISRKTARNHVQNIYAKTGVSNRAQASMFAVRNGLIWEPEPEPAAAA
jgi:HD-GYP domain-containing protein (c-di-GMP phosphodiesterase class II)